MAISNRMRSVMIPVTAAMTLCMAVFVAEVSLTHRTEYLSHTVSTSPEVPAKSGKLVQGYVALNIDSASRRPSSEVCLPEADETPAERCLEFPRDFSVGRYKVLGVKEWNVDRVSKVCYHDWLIRKWKEGITRLTGKQLTKKICQESSQDDSIGMTVKTPQCTIFDDAQSVGNIPVSISYLEGHIFMSDGKYVLHTLRSNVPLPELKDGKQLLVKDETCILVDLEKQVVNNVVPWGPKGFKVGAIYYRLLSQFSVGGQRCWTATGELEVCECDIDGDEASPLLDNTAATFLATQVGADEKRAVLDAFCHLCESKPTLSVKLGLICSDGHMTKIKTDYIQAHLQFENGVFRSQEWCLSLKHGVLINCGNTDYVKKLEYFPPFVYLNNHAGLLNCTTDKSSKSLTDVCTVIPQSAEVDLSKHLQDYHTAHIFFPKTKQQLDNLKDMMKSTSLGGVWDGFKQVYDWIKDILIILLVIGAVVIGYLVRQGLTTYQPVQTVERVLPGGTRISSHEV